MPGKEKEYYTGPCDVAWNTIAQETFEFRIEPPDKRYRIYLTGPCPRCEHMMEYDTPTHVFSGITMMTRADNERLIDLLPEQVRNQPIDMEIDMPCRCSVTHAADKEGCGACWVFRAVERGG